MDTIFIAAFKSMYPEDNYTLGAFRASASAEQAIEAAIAWDKRSYPDYPMRDKQKSYNYDIHELELQE